MPECTECSEPIDGKVRRGRCEKCYRRHLRELKKRGEYTPPLKNTEHPGERVLRSVEKTPGGCWLLTGTLHKGYGVTVVRDDGGRIQPHRAVYEFLVGPIQPGMELDHICHTQDKTCQGGASCKHRRCVNPDHLEPVAGEVNNARSNSPTAINARKERCIRGHEFTPENTLWRIMRNGKVKPSRRCRECQRIHRQRYRERRANP